MCIHKYINHEWAGYGFLAGYWISGSFWTPNNIFKKSILNAYPAGHRISSHLAGYWISSSKNQILIIKQICCQPKCFSLCFETSKTITLVTRCYIKNFLRMLFRVCYTLLKIQFFRQMPRFFERHYTMWSSLNWLYRWD